ncbi:hypothetical protein HYFRA_00000603 [Hymenoscyphus fraxineus]|uniref:Uncharacterized protein n=1 Tax=Hymenoscyphus fraxineus TaxID=746836 RepID=A0A9N9PLD8_9HELO|nr:hypothetical protein HYFRA_00000603 [Hymenoscyphus fraxineus]
MFLPLYILILGLSGTLLALPNPNTLADSTFESPVHDLRLPFACGKIICPLDQQATWDQQQTKCICKPVPVSEAKNLELRQLPFTCPTIRCSAGFHPLYNPASQNCSCEKDLDPATCPNVRCRGGFRALYVPSTGRCKCEQMSAAEVACQATTCASGTLGPFFDAATETCSCTPDIEEREPLPESCPLIRCRGGFRAVYLQDEGRCTCQELPAAEVECQKTICASGTIGPLFNSTTSTCSCEIAEPIPESCPQMKCMEHSHVVFHPETGKCRCDEDCPTLMCVITRERSYNITTNTCSCARIPGIEGSPKPNGWANRGSGIGRTPMVPKCDKELTCVGNKAPVFNAILGACQCEWRGGKKPDFDAFLDGLTRTSDRKERRVGTLSVSSAVPTRTRIPSSLPMECLTMLCPSEKYVFYNSETGRCACVPFPRPGLSTSPIPSLDTELRTARDSSSTSDACPGTVCISEMAPFYDLSTKSCSCEYIPGLEPGENFANFLEQREVAATSMAPIPTPSATLPDPMSIPACFNITVMDWIRCPDTKQPEVWSSEENACVCAGESSTVTSVVVTATLSTSMVPKPTSGVGSCAEVFCISEQRPVWDVKEGKCVCEWIEGLKPGGV